MQKSKALFRTGFLALLVFCIILCSFTTGMVRHNISQGTPFQTLPPINATLPTPIGTQTPVVTPIPTLGPGQYFEEGQQPEISTIHGDDEFGWGELARNEDLLLVWVTDSNGKHYLVIRKDNEKFLGDKNLQDGFIHYIGNEEKGRTALVRDWNKSENLELISAVVTIGCGVAILLGPPGWVSLAIAGGGAFAESRREAGIQSNLEKSISQLEGNLITRFFQMRYPYPHSWR